MIFLIHCAPINCSQYDREHDIEFRNTLQTDY